MKHFTTIICIAFTVLISCSDKAIPLKSTPDNTPFEVKTNKSFNEVWDNIIDLFAQKGLSIRMIDKSSGLIISGQTILVATVEDNAGKLENPNAHIVVAKTYNVGRDKSLPVVGYHPTKSKNGKSELNEVYGEWNVRVKQSSNEGCTINVNLVNIEYLQPDGRSAFKKPLATTDYYSTKVFETLIANLIK